jgi:trehalose-phosphatase
VKGLPRFWDRVREAPRVLLALDYDGTLAPFRRNPARARPLRGVREALEAIRRRADTEVAIVSGRPVREIADLLGGLAVRMLGSHGFEERDPAGRVERLALEPEQEVGLELARAAADQIPGKGRLERKAASLALHTRGLRRSRAARIQAAVHEVWTDLAHAGALEVLDFNGGVEIRCRGWHKGHVVRRLVQLQPPEALPIYIGDDTTDEDAFQALEGIGIGIKVGRGTTLAPGRLAGCREVRSLLRAYRDLPEAADL